MMVTPRGSCEQAGHKQVTTLRVAECKLARCALTQEDSGQPIVMCMPGSERFSQWIILITTSSDPLV